MLGAALATALPVSARAFAALVLAFCPALIHAQSAGALLPSASADKAREILEQATEALGGQSYLGLRNSVCTGRVAQFERSGAVGGFIEVRDWWGAPDKNRTQYDKDGNFVQLYAGDEGWTLDRGGVTELGPEVLAEYQEQRKSAMSTILRYRLKEEGVTLRYAGADVVDLKEADWVEVSDRDGRLTRIAIDQRTHLPVRSVVVTRDPVTRQRSERATYYSNYQPISGIQTPFQVSRFVDDRQVYQMFYDNCQYNASLPDDIFSRASLDRQFGRRR
jgi:hypothetical protein